ncbi:MAG: DUF933 domain-containing protein [Candidatus Omnitrophota bacterium]
MKIFNFGLDIEPGKHKYQPEHWDKLVEKFSPQKVTPYPVEFITAEPESSDAIVFDLSKKLDLILIDLEKIEKRITRSEDEKEKQLLAKATGVLEGETLLSDIEFSPQEAETLKLLQLITYKPCLGMDKADQVDGVIGKVIGKAGIVLFFTAGKKEVRAWGIKKGENILEAAGKIHSDLKRGFIKADITKACDLDNFFNMAEAKSRGFVKTVGRDYIVQAGDIIEIRFNV